MKDSLILYTQQYEAIKHLSSEDKGLLLDAIFSYHITQSIPVGLSPVVSMAFSFIRTSIDIDNKKYQKKCERNRENAAKRWEENNVNGCERIRTDAMDTDTDTDTDTKVIPPVSPKLFPEEKPKKGRYKKVEFVPPEENVVFDYFKNSGLSDWKVQASKFFNHYNSQGWKKGTGVAVVNWDSLANNWILTEKQKDDGKNKRGIGQDGKQKPVYGRK